ncbi:hypothetical protein C8A00DRAFT_34997 [Chaetomidium leptoderma]|uniref:non-specific serine/threonine protein kinase n=1 Tax=Chaetomidium leptoderma TaxID=669021 RepID=A0AAN6ZVC4_9PEZI|nr:hypothetical protein C8A00DRAFT_34997 [Chaetomidium leptoderma]
MSDITPVTVPSSVYTTDLHSDLTEHLQWYGAGKLHPTHLGDALHNNRYHIVHKLDHHNHSLSWLARDTATNTWRRIAVVHGSSDVTRGYELAADRMLRERSKSTAAAAADAKGILLAKFFEHGPNGTHLCMVFPLNGEVNGFRWGLPERDASVMNEAWFVRQCAKLRGGGGGNNRPANVHAITEKEMLMILGRPRVIEVDDELRAGALAPVAAQQHGGYQVLPRYLVLRPDKIEEDVDFWLSSRAFER